MARGQEKERTERQGDKRKGGKEDRGTGGQEDRTGGTFLWLTCISISTCATLLLYSYNSQ